MKKDILLVYMMFISICSYAGNPFGNDTTYQWLLKTRPAVTMKGQKQIGSVSAIKGESRLYCFYYIDDATYNNKPIVDVRSEFYDDSCLNSETEVCNKFIIAANEQCSKELSITGNPNRISRYVMKLHIKRVDSDGETYLYAMIFDTINKELVFQKYYNANGGRIGSLLNLMGDAAKRLGKKVGDDLNRR